MKRFSIFGFREDEAGCKASQCKAGVSDDKLNIGFPDTLDRWSACNTLAWSCCLCLFHAATSQGSSMAWNCKQVWSRNCLMRAPNSVVRSSKCSNVDWLCILSFAKLCHSAVLYNNFIRCLLWGSSRSPSNAGMEHWVRVSVCPSRLSEWEITLPVTDLHNLVWPVFSFQIHCCWISV